MSDNPDRALEELAGRPEAPPENAREQETEEGGGLRSVSKIVALVSASVLVGGGIGMLVGVWLGAINPFALGIVGAVAGMAIPVFFALGARGAARRPWWRRLLGG
jgi:F0F1-type ATP synthase assembly protein I